MRVSVFPLLLLSFLTAGGSRAQEVSRILPEYTQTVSPGQATPTAALRLLDTCMGIDSITEIPALPPLANVDDANVGGAALAGVRHGRFSAKSGRARLAHRSPRASCPPPGQMLNDLLSFSCGVT